MTREYLRKYLRQSWLLMMRKVLGEQLASKLFNLLSRIKQLAKSRTKT
jgi:hypothetical protein